MHFSVIHFVWIVFPNRKQITRSYKVWQCDHCIESIHEGFDNSSLRTCQVHGHLKTVSVFKVKARNPKLSPKHLVYQVRCPFLDAWKFRVKIYVRFYTPWLGAKFINYPLP